MTEWVGKTFSKVRIETLLARGGMAEVYLGTHTTLNRPVAVKILHRHLEGQPDLQLRFEREAQVLAGLRHPHIVQVYDFDVLDGQPFIVMEYVPGVSLSAYLNAVHAQGGRLSLKQIGQLLTMLVSALDYAHGQGVIHRDIKPANILLTAKTSRVQPGEPLPTDVEAILTDFGLLRLAQSASQTSSGTVSGTPAYMSPEQARGEKVDYRSDLYSLGVTLYEMLAGRVPFEADTSMAVLLKHIQEPPPPIEGLPGSLQLVLDRILAKDPAERFASAQEFLLAFLDASNLAPAGFSSASQPYAELRLAPESRTTLPVTPPAAVPVPKQNSIPWLPLVLLLGALILAGIWLFRPSPVQTAPTPSLLPAASATLAEATPAPTATTAPESMAGHQMDEMAAQDEPVFGILRFYSVAGLLDEVILNAPDLPQPEAGFQYEAWLTGDEVRRSLGVLTLPGAGGQAGLTFLDEQGRNLLVRYGRLEISLEPSPDANPNSSGNIVYSSGIPPLALEHLRHLFVSFNQTPEEIGLIVGLERQVLLTLEHTQLMLNASQDDDLAAVRAEAEAAYNLLVGSQAGGYGDLDGDGTVADPGDGFGLLLNGENVGYLEGTISHTGFAMTMEDASANIVIHGDHVIHSVRNIEGWAVELAELLRQIAASGSLDDDTRALALQSLALADRMVNGRDLDGNERIEPVPGEGGLLTALDHAVYMLDMPLFAGEGRLPSPEPAQADGEHDMPPGYAP